MIRRHIPCHLYNNLVVGHLREVDQLLAVLPGYQQGGDVDIVTVTVVSHDDAPDVIRSEYGVLFVHNDDGMGTLLPSNLHFGHERTLSTTNHHNVNQTHLEFSLSTMMTAWA